jgi:hypothetical protein
MLRRHNDIRDAQTLGKISMNIVASSVLSRTDDFQPSFRSDPSLISSGIDYGMPTARPLPDTNGARPESDNGWLVFERSLLRLLAKTLTSYLGFIASPLSEQDASETRTIVTNVSFTATPASDSDQIFDAIQALYLSNNNPRDRQIADRLTTLRHIAIEEDQYILPSSMTQMACFFLNHPGLGLPKITLTPDGTLRARWIKGPNNFVAIEFTGSPSAKLVAEIPVENKSSATYFSSQPLKTVVSAAQRLGASFK